MSTTSPLLSGRVEKVMSRSVVLMLEGVPMAEARAIAVQYDYNGFPIVTQEGRLVGILTKGDLLRAARATLEGPGVWQDSVARWMAHGVLALRAGDSLATAVDLMVESGLRSLPVIDDRGLVIGIVSRNDLMAAIC
ncbi:MAG TPA: CBS domain-containing protein [Candidatus Methylomirabilis sp.]|nr:CBS domain-containing protein [Candidatus Methylomirabilis sp.]